MRPENYVYLPRIDAQIYGVSYHLFKSVISPSENYQFVISRAQSRKLERTAGVGDSLTYGFTDDIAIF